MHRSQLGGLIIDCQDGDLAAAADFWQQALGYEAKPLTESEDDLYRGLDTGPNGIHIEVQRVDHPSRVHLDIETDDVDTEVERLEALGAKRLERVKGWVVMEAPTGHRFCVVKVQRDNFAETATEWRTKR